MFLRPDTYAYDKHKLENTKHPMNNQRFIVALLSSILWVLFFSIGLIVLIRLNESNYGFYREFIQNYIIMGIILFTAFLAFINFLFYRSRKK